MVSSEAFTLVVRCRIIVLFELTYPTFLPLSRGSGLRPYCIRLVNSGLPIQFGIPGAGSGFCTTGPKGPRHARSRFVGLKQYRSVKEDVFNRATKASSILSSRGGAERSRGICFLVHPQQHRGTKNKADPSLRSGSGSTRGYFLPRLGRWVCSSLLPLHSHATTRRRRHKVSDIGRPGRGPWERADGARGYPPQQAKTGFPPQRAKTGRVGDPGPAGDPAHAPSTPSWVPSPNEARAPSRYGIGRQVPLCLSVRAAGQVPR